jgi:hypothetical protein
MQGEKMTHSRHGQYALQSNSRNLKMLPWSWFSESGCVLKRSSIFAIIHQFLFDSGSGKHFQALKMRTIDSPHKFTPRKSFSGRKSKNFRFSLQYTHSDSLIQNHGSLFKFWDCAQPISRINLPPESHFQAENLKFPIFASIHTLRFPDSGSGKSFQALKMCTIDTPHKISSNRVIFEKKFGSKKHEKISQIPVFLYTLQLCYFLIFNHFFKTSIVLMLSFFANQHLDMVIKPISSRLLNCRSSSKSIFISPTSVYIFSSKPFD